MHCVVVNACGDKYFYEASGMDEAVRMYYREKTRNTSDAVGVFIEGNERVGFIP
ncbi:hypothetical protein [Mycobacteroides abscessus]|uniref:hypothetical protein n=1 Tax=Mycobacteroides abscessus TaxID=36809 RepID=UPI00092648E4|nr:hypothetical protein [Mycobacteroides abscessus]SHP44988.1 Uncharacterised protein [Mycobacteroides abscessus subsp. abscessus]SHQ50886.1 Uncharacterised protein [Mycobacteroides abscessus subsp. abscessus]SHQ51744.1 Uncharacterised protein [Mycobacteroides abscessus subsp. abscessus]SHS76460.1 Uncharacterised protein [Mycobacteroides abscessus subsp. abscessus]SHT52544.1 Uncharacterised protein [Mycobacteroides abscessus subsp. abscessus]